MHCSPGKFAATCVAITSMFLVVSTVSAEPPMAVIEVQFINNHSVLKVYRYYGLGEEKPVFADDMSDAVPGMVKFLPEGQGVLLMKVKNMSLIERRQKVNGQWKVKDVLFIKHTDLPTEKVDGTYDLNSRPWLIESRKTVDYGSYKGKVVECSLFEVDEEHVELIKRDAPEIRERIKRNKLRDRDPVAYLESINKRLAELEKKQNGDRVDAADNWREFSDVSGRFKIIAKFQTLIGGKVKLLRKDTGKTIAIPMSKLSEADQNWIRAKQKR